MVGSSLSAMSVVLIDSNVVSQLVQITYELAVPACKWWGLSTGNMGSFTSTISNKTFPTAGNAQFLLSASVSGAQTGDMANFVTMAASHDAGQPKKLLFLRQRQPVPAGTTTRAVPRSRSRRAAGSMP